MRVHFIAIGGAAMHNLAIALHKKGYTVSGSDDEIFEPSRSRLDRYNLLPEAFGWYPEKITSDIDAIILGMHARIDNPELLEAQKQGIKIYSYPEFLYEQTKNKKRVVIAGSHGKTTITSMIMHVLKFHNINFDYMVGSQIEGFDTMVNLEEHNKIAVFEGDEYLSSPIDMRSKFLHYNPHIALISGIAWDHINVFPTFDGYKEQFMHLINDIQDNGHLVYYKNDEHLIQMSESFPEHIQVMDYDTHKHEINSGKTTLITESQNYSLEIFGTHNLQNLNGARLVLNQLNISNEQFYQAIQSFQGAAKRLQLITETDNSKVFIDFAHAPSKLKATLEAVREQFPNHNLIACMELHTFSSLNKDFLSEYEGSMNPADDATVFFSPETVKHKNLEEITPEMISEAFQRNDLNVISEPNKLNAFFTSIDLSNTIVLLMSSGNFGGVNVKDIFKLKINSRQ